MMACSLCIVIQSKATGYGDGDANGAKILSFIPLHARWLTDHTHLQLSVCQCGYKLSMKRALLLSISFVWLVNNSKPTPPCMSLSVQINN